MPDLAPEVQHRQKDAQEAERLDLAKAARLRLALTAGAEELFTILQESDQDVVKNILKNPHLSEEHLLALLKRALPEQVIKGLQRHPLVTGSRRLKMALAAHPETPAAMLYSLLPQLFLFELVNLMQLPGVQADLKHAAERAILLRLPETELGKKITIARRGSPAILEALLKTGEPRLVDAVLSNPKLKESGVHAFLASPAAKAETISAVARNPRWGSRPNLRLAMLRNPRTPRIWFTLFLPSLPGHHLELLRGSRALEAEQVAAVQQEWEKRRAS